MAKNNDLIQKIFGKEDFCKGIKIGFGKTLVEFIAQDSTNKLDSRTQLIDGQELESKFSSAMMETLNASKWKRLRKRLGKELSRSGIATVQVDYINDKPFVSMGDYVSHTKVAGTLTEVVLKAEGIRVVNDVEYNIHERFYLEDGKVMKMFGIYVDGEWRIAEEDPIAFPGNITKIPVVIFENNEDVQSDIQNTRLWDAVEALDEFSNKIEETQALSKLGLIVNRNMTGGKSGDAVMKSLKEKGYVEVNGMDAQLGGGISPTGAVGYVVEIMALVDWLEDKIMKYSFTTRDTASTGTNKHNAEIGMFNQFAIEYLLDKKEIRESDYAEFYGILGMFFGEDYSNVKVELQISQVLQNMLDAMNPETPRVQENINKEESGGDNGNTKPEGNK